MPTPLFRSLCLPVTLHNAWKVVKSKNSAGGIDGFSVTQFEERLAENLAALREELIAGKWNPEPYLRVEIPKKEKEVRKLGLLSVRDKIVQQAIKTLIEPKLEKIFLNNSYGYRPGKGPARAIHRVMNIYRQMKQGYTKIVYQSKPRNPRNGSDFIIINCIGDFQKFFKTFAKNEKYIFIRRSDN